MALGRIGTGLIEEIRQPEENTKRINRRTFVLGAAAAEIAAPSIARAAEPRYMPGLVAFLTLSAESLATGDIAEARLHFDRAIALYNRTECRPLASRFGVDAGVSILTYRSWALWFLGYPKAALTDVDDAIRDAREIGQAATLVYALGLTSMSHVFFGNYAAASAQSDEVVAWADEKGALFYKGRGMLTGGCVSAVTDKAADAVQMITSGITARRSTGATLNEPLYLAYLAKAHSDLGQLDDAWRCIDEAIRTTETTNEGLWEAEVNRIAGEIACKSPERDAAKAEARFERALAVARGQQAKSFELRAAMSLARLWRDQGKPQQARELLAPVYGWFTEGFDTRDLKEAKTLLDELGL